MGGEGAWSAGMGIYVHVPYCRRKCPYCDFSSRATAVVPEGRYVAALEREMALVLPATRGRVVTSIYFGGGTPSLLTADGVARVVAAIRGSWEVAVGAEITLEANPESVTGARLSGYRLAGVTRISLGVQALEAGRLALLGRPHGLEEVAAAVAWIAEVGFPDGFNLDLIYGTPGQTVASWLRELAIGLQWGPDHLSCYQLTVEEGTAVHAWVREGRWVMPGEEEERDLLLSTRRFLAERGWPAYEISNFARPGRGCRHNLAIWEYGDYLGLGAAAHGKLSTVDGVGYRLATVAAASAYLLGLEAGVVPRVEEVRLSPREMALEYLLQGLRLDSGLDGRRYAMLGGVALGERRGVVLRELAQAGLIRVTPTHVQLTEEGVAVANRVILALG